MTSAAGVLGHAPTERAPQLERVQWWDDCTRMLCEQEVAEDGPAVQIDANARLSEHTTGRVTHRRGSSRW